MDSTKKRRIIYILLFLAIIGYMISVKQRKEAQQEKSRIEAEDKKNPQAYDEKVNTVSSLILV
ncbi:MAG: hypothetical protein AAF611_18355 [Bacteroidota bacterium]